MAIVLLLIVGSIIGVGVRYSVLHRKDNKHIAIYIPNSSGTGYELSNYQKIPEGYILDVEETNAHCWSGITVSWDDNTRTISMTATSGGGCNLYLEEEEEDPLQIISATMLFDNIRYNYIVNVILNRQVTISKYVLTVDNTSFEFDSSYNRINLNNQFCFAKNKTYNYTLYAITTEQTQSEIYNGSYTTPNSSTWDQCASGGGSVDITK